MSKVIPLVLLILLAACAQSPQQVRVAPALTALTANANYQGVVAVSAVDDRSNKNVGSLGGIYSDTSVVTLSAGVEDALVQTFSEALRSLGFNTGPASGTNVELILKELVLELKKDGVKRSATTSCRIQIRATRDMDTLKGDYRAEFDHVFVIAPNEEDIAVYVNQAIAGAMDQALDDGRLREFLAGR